jgi:lipoprotein signal peptidase
VRDFVSIGDVFGYSWPIFNLADVWVSLGVLLILVYEFIEGGEKKV